MKLTSVTITYGRKINLGDYNNANLKVNLGADIEEGDDLNAVMHDLWHCARENVRVHAQPLLRRGTQDDVDAAYLGLPSQIDQWQPRGDGSDTEPEDDEQAVMEMIFGSD
jgi:hypothetical protein